MTLFDETKTYLLPAEFRPWTGETYYGQPAINASHYGLLISAYFYVGGMASAAQFLATTIDLFGRKEDRPLVGIGRILALLGALISPPLLIADLHTPQRWYNMLRIYRGTSAMSIGTWALSAFGVLSGVAFVGQILESWWGWTFGKWLARAASIPAALAGAIVAIYTGTLLAATATPLWASAFPFLSSLFACSAASTAGAALTLASTTSRLPASTRRRLTWFTLVSGLAELIVALIIQRGWRRYQVDHPLETTTLGPIWKFGVLGLGITLPVGLHAFELASGKELRITSSLAAIATLIGGFLLRFVFVEGGKKSGRRPQDYFKMTN